MEYHSAVAVGDISAGLLLACRGAAVHICASPQPGCGGRRRVAPGSAVASRCNACYTGSSGSRNACNVDETMPRV